MMKQVLFILFVLTNFWVQAQWNNGTSTNNLVCGTSPKTGKSGNVSTTDGAGGMIIAWIDSRDSASKSIYAQRILADGTLKFSQEVLISNATGDSSSYKANVVIVSDSAGGAIIAWQDARNTRGSLNPNTDVYGQRIDGDGNVLWAKDGVRLSLVGNTQSNKISALPVMVSKTEFIFIFGDNRLGTSDLYAQKVAVKDGSLLWASDVSLHGNQPGVQTSIVTLSDGKGGAFVVWQDPRQASNNSDIYGQYIDNGGNAAWGTTGLGICTAKNQQLTPRIISDDNGGIVVTWSDQRAGAGDGNIYVQSVNALGVAKWATDGILVCDFLGNQSVPNIIKGGSGFIIEWSDARNGTNDRNLYAQSIDINGNTKWTTITEGGLPVCVATGNQPNNNNANGIKLLSDGKKGAIIIWDDSRNKSTNVDIYAQHLDSLGAIFSGWATDGNVICNALQNQQAPNTELDEFNNVIVVWRDSRDSLNAFYASKISPSGSLILPVKFVSIEALQINSSIKVNWATDVLNQTSEFIVQNSIDGVNFYAIGIQKRSSTGKYSYVHLSPIAGENYYRVVYNDNIGFQRYSPVVKIRFNKKLTENISSYPNPFSNSIVLSLVNYQFGKYSVNIITPNGKVVKQTQINISSNSQTQLIETNGLSAGTYFLQIGNTKGILFSKSIIKQ